jgi:hypothetical protein
MRGKTRIVIAGAATGRSLGNAVVAWAKASSFRAIQFNAVVSRNLVAIGLWRSLGFETVAQYHNRLPIRH